MLFNWNGTQFVDVGILKGLSQDFLLWDTHFTVPSLEKCCNIFLRRNVILAVSVNKFVSP